MPNPPRFADDNEIRKPPTDPWFARAILFGIFLILMAILAHTLYPGGFGR
jgi:preprotein translocase subunit Sec61beta